MAITGALAQKCPARKESGVRQNTCEHAVGEFNGHWNSALRTVGKSYAVIIHHNKNNIQTLHLQRMTIIKIAEEKECLVCSRAVGDLNPSRQIRSEVSG